MQAEFLRLLSPYAGRVALLMFEFPASTANAFAQPEEFAAALGTFLAALPKTFRYAVEIRHAALLDAAYFRSLREHGVAHIFNSWTDMPAIAQQTALEGAFTTNFTAVRALMRPGTAYQDSLNPFFGVAGAERGSAARHSRVASPRQNEGRTHLRVCE
jgi:uncharacterized protein YecE (DUF72 family)